MAPKSSSYSKKRPPDPNGIFQGMSVFLLPKSIQSRRLQVFKQKLEQMGATVEDHLSKKVTHVFAANSEAIVKQLANNEPLKQFKGNVILYEWLENCLKSGERLSEEKYLLNVDFEKVDSPGEVKDTRHEHSNAESSDDNSVSSKNKEDDEVKTFVSNKESSSHSDDKESSVQESDNHAPEVSESSSLYKPPDLNRNITEIFGKLIDIYRALGDDRRSFSYYKAIPVIEKLPFKIESIDQVKHLPAIGKSMQDHIHEIITTGRMSKLDHFENDEKVRSVCLFGEVWGIGPATALKLYEKGHRTLDDLKNEESLTASQKLGLKYFQDIKTRIPRNEVKDMEMLLQKVGQDILPGVIIVCGGSYRRGKATCGDMDIIITHPDGESHKGFLPKYVKYLKDINFLREDLIFSIHSTEGTDSGVDTYFGLCTYPGRELRHRIDLKVYPRSIYAFGLLAWTGNDVLNRRLRLLAESKGYRLDDTGLFLSTQSSSTKRGVRSSTSLNCKTEKDVFDVLGFPWLEPHERNL